MMLKLFLLGLLWILYGFLHSVLASFSFKRWLQRRIGSHYRYYRLGYTVFAFVSLAAVLWYQLRQEPVVIFRPPSGLVAAGWIASGAGLLLMLVCIKKYFMGLSGLLSLFRPRPPHPLIISGVHRFVRHPLYLGTFIFLWGLLPAFPYAQVLIANTVITLYTLIGIRLEEAKLIDEFGDSYRRYRKNVPMLLPFRNPKQDE